MKSLIGFIALAASFLFAQSDPRPPLFAKAPERARAKPNPVAGDMDALRGGRKLFEQHCAECHGAGAEGGGKAPPLINDDIARATPGEIHWLITNGVVRRGMPAWSKLPSIQRWQIVSYLQSLNMPQGSGE